jgi:hypothetical protein
MTRLARMNLILKFDLVKGFKWHVCVIEATSHALEVYYTEGLGIVRTNPFRFLLNE